MKCRQCKKHVSEGLSLMRMNETGVPGIWECTPGTGCNRIVGEPEPSQDQKVLGAIAGKTNWN